MLVANATGWVSVAVVPIGAPLAEILTQAIRGKLPAARVVLNRTAARRHGKQS